VAAIDEQTGLLGLDRQLIPINVDNLPDDSTSGHDLIALAQLLYHLPLPLLLLFLGTDQDEVKNGEKEQHLSDENHRRVATLPGCHESQASKRRYLNHGGSSFRVELFEDTRLRKQGITPFS